MRRVTQTEKPINLTGMLLPWNPLTNQPAFVFLEGMRFLVLFSTLEKLKAAREHFQGVDVAIKQIGDGAEFLESVRGQIRIMIDPWINDEGNTRFVEIPNV